MKSQSNPNEILIKSYATLYPVKKNEIRNPRAFSAEKSLQRKSSWPGAP
jgi:hypothetical protein